MKSYTISIEGNYLSKKGDFRQTQNPKLLTYKEAKERAKIYKLFGWDCKIVNTRNNIDKKDWEIVK